MGTSKTHTAHGDFTADRRVLVLSLMALVIGAVCAFVAKGLAWLIGSVTNLAFYARFSSRLVSPSSAHGPWIVFIPIAGGLIVGLMARFGSEKIRGHGIPEAMEAILIGGSKIDPKVAVLKPISSAISIGTGGPFGAEGPIIMTGGAFGSLFAQMFHLSAAERKALLVAGAAAGMSAIFGTPLAAVILAVELLLFEWKPRSLIPVVVASSVAALIRPALFGSGALFPVPGRLASGWPVLAAALVLGIVTGAASAAVTGMVYGFEDLFMRLPIHWSWWPAIGGLAIGIGGLIQPHALGIGYDDIRMLLDGRFVGAALVSLLVVKALIWSFSLGSGTSGGVLAPLLIVGGSIGALAGHVIPVGSTGMWAMVGMAAMIGGTMRSPLTSVIFIFELTHNPDSLLPVLVASTAAFAFTVLFMKRSILTEKVARRGHHVIREYAVDPLELIRTEEGMTAAVESVPASWTLQEFLEFLTSSSSEANPSHRHEGYPVLEEGRLVGMITRADVLNLEAGEQDPDLKLAELVDNPISAHPSEPLARVADKMAANNLGRIPIIDQDRNLVGIVTRRDLLNARARTLKSERDRERSLRLPLASRK